MLQADGDELVELLANASDGGKVQAGVRDIVLFNRDDISQWLGERRAENAAGESL